MSLLRRERLHNPLSELAHTSVLRTVGGRQLVELLMRRERMLSSER
jgi:hypothetical protein